MHAVNDRNAPVVILGTGYTGRYLYRLAAANGFLVLAGSRSPEHHLAALPMNQRMEFDLERPATWNAIPAGARVIWCFPARPVDSVMAFAEHLFSRSRHVVVLGSTSAYVSGHPTAIIDESSPIDLTQARVAGEERLRREYHAVILRVAGIYGPGRNILDWIRDGRVTASSRFVNVIHVEDLAALCLLALERGRPGEVYNVSDGEPRRWSDICTVARHRWGVTARPAESGDVRAGKRISNAKVMREFGYQLQFPDVYAALASLRADALTSSRPGGGLSPSATGGHSKTLSTDPTSSEPADQERS